MPNSKELTERWYNDVANRAHLAGLLMDPVMQEALRICLVTASEPVAPPPGTYNLTEYGALLGFTRQGAFNILKTLEDLARTKPVRPQEAPAFDPEAQKKFTGK